MPGHLRAYGIAAVLLALAAPLVGQSTETEIAARLKDKPLYIRGSWSDRTLHFDGNGDITMPSERSSFTLDGFSLSSIKLKDGVLTLSGGQVGVEFKKDVATRIDLPSYGRTIKIEAPPNGDFGPALDAIFADGLEALAPSLPDYWQAWARKSYPGAYAARAAETGAKPPAPGAKTFADGSGRVNQVGGDISAPRLLRDVEPHYGDLAIALGYSGKAIVTLIVEADGHPSNVGIVKPMGLGLDEMALVAVQQYRFAPSMRGGKPVRVEVYVEVDFWIP